jgi:hypothetical protein
MMSKWKSTEVTGVPMAEDYGRRSSPPTDADEFDGLRMLLRNAGRLGASASASSGRELIPSGGPALGIHERRQI